MTSATPFLSVIVPAHQAERVLPRCLAALEASDLPRNLWELVVVDDASTDATSLLAAEYADAVIGLAGNPHGPAYARNRGFEASRGRVVVFVDSDVCVHPDTLRRFAVTFAGNPRLGAAFGSYDADPPAPGLVSQFRNLLHHYVHHRGRGDAETFWAGCGAVTREAFAAVGMFDEWHYSRPQIEDIELGRRLRNHGYPIRLEPEIQCTHLKQWTLSGVIRTDFQHRGTPWMWLLLREGTSATPATLNLQAREKVCTLAVGVAALAILGAIFSLSLWPLAVALAATLLVVLLNGGFYAFLARKRGIVFAASAIPIHLLFYFTGGVCVFSGLLLNVLLGEPSPPPAVEAHAGAGIKTWPPAANPPARSTWKVAGGEGRRAR